MHTKITKEQLNRLNTAQAAGEPVPADIREIVFNHLGLDKNEPHVEGLLFQAARNLGKTEEQLIDEVFRRQGLDPNAIIDYNVAEIPDNERWLHTPEMKAKLAHADEWMRDNPPRETDIDELLNRLEQRQSASTHIVLHLYLDYEYVPIRSHRPIMNIIERLGWKPYDLGGDYVYSRSDSTFSDALDLLQAMKAGLPWFGKALHAAWTLEATEAIDLKEALESEDGE